MRITQSCICLLLAACEAPRTSGPLGSPLDEPGASTSTSTSAATADPDASGETSAGIETDHGSTTHDEPASTTEGDDTSPSPWDPPPWEGEPECDMLTDLADLEATFDPADFMSSAALLAERRYPPGRVVLDVDNAWLWFMSPGTFTALVHASPTAFHENVHAYDGSLSRPGTRTFHLRDDVHITASRLDTFPRAEIATVHEFPDIDYRAAVYLANSAGQQGFWSVLEELNAYTHGLAVAHCLRDYGVGGDHRDAVLVFMYYVEEYLGLARTRHPADYDALLADQGTVEMIVASWRRAEHWLGEADAALGIHDAYISGIVYAEDNFEEIVHVAVP